MALLFKCATAHPHIYRLVQVLQIVMQHNFPAIVMSAGIILALHYLTVVKSTGCPIVVAEGESQTGKSTALKVARALLGKYWLIYSEHV